MLLFDAVSLCVLVSVVILADLCWSTDCDPPQPLPPTDSSSDGKVSSSLILYEIPGPSDNESCQAACLSRGGLRGYCVLTTNLQCHRDRSRSRNTHTPEIGCDPEEVNESESISISSSDSAEFTNEPFTVCVCEYQSVPDDAQPHRIQDFSNDGRFHQCWEKHEKRRQEMYGRRLERLRESEFRRRERRYRRRERRMKRREHWMERQMREHEHHDHIRF